MSYRSRNKFQKTAVNSVLKNPFSEFNPHDYESPVMRTENIITISIDPGIVNCGVYIDCYNTVTKTHKSLHLARMNFKKSDNFYIECMKKLDELENEFKFLTSAHYIIIESQMTVSYDNTRMAQHLITYFCTKLKNRGNRAIIIELSSQAKTKFLDCPRKMKKYDYKKWCKQRAIDFLKEIDSEEESKFISCLELIKKGDDMGDSICQYYAWKKIFDSKLYSFSLPVKRFE